MHIKVAYRSPSRMMRAVAHQAHAGRSICSDVGHACTFLSLGCQEQRAPPDSLPIPTHTERHLPHACHACPRSKGTHKAALGPFPCVSYGFTDLRIYPPPSPSCGPTRSRGSENQITAGQKYCLLFFQWLENLYDSNMITL